MTLSPRMLNNSLDELLSEAGELSPFARDLITKVNAMMAEADVVLSYQSDKLKAAFFRRVQELQNANVDEAACMIVTEIKQKLASETEKNKKEHRGHGHYDLASLYQRDFKDQMQDHDMTMLMPRSSLAIDVLAPIDIRVQTDAAKEGLLNALNNAQIKHIFIPIGPGHWRGVYLTKPECVNEKFNLELFDPYGPRGARQIQSFTLKILSECGINRAMLDIEHTGPSIPQKDGYACGDFVCAKSHQKMQELGAENGYDPRLIQVYDNYGNQDDLLRAQCRTMAYEINNPQGNISADFSINEQLKRLEGLLSQNERKIVTQTAEVHGIGAKTLNYKYELASLISNRNSIFSKAEIASVKEYHGHTLTDEELAAKLQAEEFLNAGIKP